MSRADFLVLFASSESEEPKVVKFTEKNYDYSSIDFVINSPCVISSENSSVFKCKSLVITANNVQMKGITFEGSIVLRTSENFIANECDFSRGYDSGGSLVLTGSHDCKIMNCTFHDTITGVFLEYGSSVIIDNVKMWKLIDRNISLSHFCHAEITNCNFSDSNGTAVACLCESNILLANTVIKDIRALGLHFSTSSVEMHHCTIENIEQNGINIQQCKSAKLYENNFINTGSSSLSLIAQTNECEIYKNTFTDIHGNAVIQNEESKSNIHDNTAVRIDYPSFAILGKSSAIIKNNHIDHGNKAGICVRGANDVLIQDNTISNVNDTGISVSDSQNIKVLNNTITNCAVAGIESYNKSNVTCNNNVFSNPGKTALMCYAGATLNASKNTIKEPGEAMVLITTHGSGDFEDNILEKCEKQFIGETTGVIYMKGNGSFENLTNDETRTSDDVRLIPHYEDTKKGKCLKCGLKDREGFLSPCGHKIYCKECGENAVKNNEICPLCRFPIESFACPHSQGLEDGQCAICMQNPCDAIILPCGHTGYCSQCLAEWFSDNSFCPACRTEHATFKWIHNDF